MIAHIVAGQAVPAALVIGNGLALSSTAVVLQASIDLASYTYCTNSSTMGPTSQEQLYKKTDAQRNITVIEIFLKSKNLFVRLFGTSFKLKMTIVIKHEIFPIGTFDLKQSYLYR